jgi:ribonuclease HI
MYFDGSLMKKGASMGLVFISLLGVRMRYMVRLHFPMSNNMVEYEALINGLHITIELGIRQLDIRGDSQLIINQVMKESSYHNPKIAMYCREVQKLEDKFDGLELDHIPQRLNEATDELAKMASSRESVLAGVFASDQHKPSICYEELKEAGDKLPATRSGARASNEPLTTGLEAGVGNQSLTLGSGAGLAVTHSDLEVMEIDEDGDEDMDIESDDDQTSDWRTPFLDCLIRENSRQTGRWPNGLRIAPNPLSSSKESSTRRAPPESCSGASPSSGEESC